MPNITRITQHGAPPARFVAIASPTLPLSILWAIDGDERSRPQCLRYLAQIQSVFSDMGPIDMLLAKRLVQYAKVGAEPNLIYGAVFALTELNGGRSVVIDTYDQPKVEIVALEAADYEGALAEFDARGFEPAPGPGPK